MEAKAKLDELDAELFSEGSSVEIESSEFSASSDESETSSVHDKEEMHEVNEKVPPKEKKDMLLRTVDEWNLFRKSLPSFNLRDVILFPDVIFLIFLCFLVSAFVTIFYVAEFYYIGQKPWDYRGELHSFHEMRRFEVNGSFVEYFENERGWPHFSDQKCAFKVYTFNYYTTSVNNIKQLVSAAAYIPEWERPVDIVALFRDPFAQNPDFYYTPSESPLDSMEGLFFGSKCYATVVIDYIGYGASSGSSFPYYIKGPLSSTAGDAIMAMIDLMDSTDASFSGGLYLSGYSVGGSTALASYLEIGQIRTYLPRYSGIEVKGISAGSSFFSLTDQIDSFFRYNSTDSPIRFVYLLYAYDRLYNIGTDEEIFSSVMWQGIRDNITEITKDTSNGTIDIDELNAKIPQLLSSALSTNITNYFANDTLDDLGKRIWEDFVVLLEQNDLSLVLANGTLTRNDTTPIRIHRCGNDEVVPLSSVEAFVTSTSETFANLTVVDPAPLMNLNHTECIYAHINETLNWFELL